MMTDRDKARESIHTPRILLTGQSSDKSEHRKLGKNAKKGENKGEEIATLKIRKDKNASPHSTVTVA